MWKTGLRVRSIPALPFLIGDLVLLWDVILFEDLLPRRGILVKSTKAENLNAKDFHRPAVLDTGSFAKK